MSKEIEEMAKDVAKSCCYKGWEGLSKDVKDRCLRDAEYFINAGYRKQVWHKVVDGDLPTKAGQYLCKCETGCYQCFNYSLIDNAFLEQDTYTKDFYVTNRVISWTELPEYKGD